LLSPLVRLCSLTRNRPNAQPPPVAWFPASARWHVISAALRLPRYFGCPPWATLLTRCSAALRLPPSLPLMSPFGLPSAGYPASPRWHVFAPAQLIRKLSRPAPPSELPCGSLSRPSPKVSIRPSGQPSVAPSRACPDARYSLRSAVAPLKTDPRKL